MNNKKLSHDIQNPFLFNLIFVVLPLFSQLEIDPVTHNTSSENSSTGATFWASAFGNSMASGQYSSAMGNSTASSSYATALGGSSAIGSFSTAMGSSSSSGFAATAMGHSTTASGSYSVAMGRNVSTNSNAGSFFFGDDDDGLRTSSIPNQFACRFKGGYYFISGFQVMDEATLDIGSSLPANGNAWLSVCDENRKENFEVLDDVEVIEKLTSVSFGSWNYKGLDPHTNRHYGIMAQDFYRLFGHDKWGTIGSDTLVNPIDMIGVTMSAIKGLNLKLKSEK